MLNETEGLTGDRVALAHWLWRQGFNTAEIAKTIYMQEHVIANNMEAIKHFIPPKLEDVI